MSYDIIRPAGWLFWFWLNWKYRLEPNYPASCCDFMVVRSRHSIPKDSHTHYTATNTIRICLTDQVVSIPHQQAVQFSTAYACRLGFEWMYGRLRQQPLLMFNISCFITFTALQNTAKGWNIYHNRRKWEMRKVSRKFQFTINLDFKGTT